MTKFTCNPMWGSGVHKLGYQELWALLGLKNYSVLGIRLPWRIRKNFNQMLLVVPPANTRALANPTTQSVLVVLTVQKENTFLLNYLLVISRNLDEPWVLLRLDSCHNPSLESVGDRPQYLGNIVYDKSHSAGDQYHGTHLGSLRAVIICNRGHCHCKILLTALHDPTRIHHRIHVSWVTPTYQVRYDNLRGVLGVFTQIHMLQGWTPWDVKIF